MGEGSGTGAVETVCFLRTNQLPPLWWQLKNVLAGIAWHSSPPNPAKNPVGTAGFLAGSIMVPTRKQLTRQRPTVRDQ